jgi:hypothetical protein
MMARLSLVMAALLGAAGLMLLSGPADAWERKTDKGVFAREGHPKSNYYRRGTRVRGYVARRGGYSYVYPDSINTYGDARGRYGAAWSLREQSLERQTPAGPFDHGYFFDSGIGSQFGGQSPYMH